MMVNNNILAFARTSASSTSGQKLILRLASWRRAMASICQVLRVAYIRPHITSQKGRLCKGKEGKYNSSNTWITLQVHCEIILCLA